MIKNPKYYRNQRDKVFERINMIEWYKKLCLNYQVDKGEEFEDFSVEKIKEIFLELGYKSKYYKSEHFFQINLDKFEDYISFINFNFKYGLIEIIWVIKRDSKEKDVMIASPLGVYIDREIRPRKPTFGSYEDLREVLEKVIEKFKECREEFIKELSEK